jgi:hypothetical protein
MQKLARLGSAFVVIATLADFSGTMPGQGRCKCPVLPAAAERMRLLYARAM